MNIYAALDVGIAKTIANTVALLLLFLHVCECAACVSCLLYWLFEPNNLPVHDFRASKHT